MAIAEYIGLALLVAVVLLIAVVAFRRVTLTRSGSIDVCWRPADREIGRGWVLGQGRYQADELDLYRSFSPLPIPSKVLRRNALVLGSRRPAEGTELDLLPLDAVIVRCTERAVAGAEPVGEPSSRDWELALSEAALTGLRSWLESAPSVTRRV
ncbi:DUF2550 domain-containing protein [Nakamurella aerolata]|uniref:DUF2550 domain-containing protein n=1 Tax=Nakamurella aerolata TaxID=1656892 RepID=A0A849A396_9ACTN|nr:DUF2550 domain-containing protein [Nakamurella aerolata]NNG34156.1 DUF2550 domain-containing protein [Nakamurella aerolata]